jgi:hypothetical protein
MTVNHCLVYFHLTFYLQLPPDPIAAYTPENPTLKAFLRLTYCNFKVCQPCESCQCRVLQCCTLCSTLHRSRMLHRLLARSMASAAANRSSTRVKYPKNNYDWRVPPSEYHPDEEEPTQP